MFFFETSAPTPTCFVDAHAREMRMKASKSMRVERLETA